MANLHDIEPIEVSLERHPKNKRRYLIMKGQAQVTEPVDDPVEPAVMEQNSDATDPVVQSDAVPEPAPTATVAPAVDAAALSREVYGLVVQHSRVVPTDVANAIAHVIRRANIDIVDIAPVEAPAELRSRVDGLLAVIPANAPADIAEAVAIVKAWGQQGYAMIEPMMEMPQGQDEGMAKVMPQNRRVVLADELVGAAQRTAAELFTKGAVDVAKQVLSFGKAVKKALPDGGLVVVSGVVPQDEDVAMANLSDIWQSGDAAMTGVIQQIVDSVSASCRSRADEILEEAAQVLQSFTDDALHCLASEGDRAARLEQLQQAFNVVGAKLPALVEKATAVGPADQVATTAALLEQAVGPLVERIANLEQALQHKALSFGPAPATPAPKSLRQTFAVAKPAQKSHGFSASDIVEMSARRRFGPA